MGQRGVERISSCSIKFCSSTHTSKSFLNPLHLHIKFHGPLNFSLRPLKKGAWHIDTALENTLLSKGVKGI